MKADYERQAADLSDMLARLTAERAELAYTNWKHVMDTVNEQTHFTSKSFDFPGTAFGTWIPRSSNAHLMIYAGIPAAELKSGASAAVLALLKDEKENRTDKCEQEWNGMWQFHSIMQFSDEFIAVSATGVDRMD